MGDASFLTRLQTFANPKYRPRSNGTRTFRRPSTTPFNNSASVNSADASQHAGVDGPNDSNLNSVNYDPSSLRYSKDQLLDIYKSTEASPGDTSTLFTPNWNPSQANGVAARAWGKSSDSPHVPQDPTVCWDSSGNTKPISLEPMSAEDRELFAGDVNSTLKPPQQNKDGSNQGGGGQNGRKTSVGAGNSNYPISSPSTASRPGTRRRETTETNPFPSGAVASPTASRFTRDESWFPRRSTELREPLTDEPAEDLNATETPARTQPYGLSRSNTGGAAFGGGASLWGPTQSPSTAGGIGAGAFGNFALPTSTIGDKRYGTGGSRLAHLMTKASGDSSSPKPADAGGIDTNRTWRPRQRTDTDPFAGDDNVSGSAILGGAQDNSPPTLASQIQRGGVFDTPVKGSTGDFGMSGLNLGSQAEGNGPASPSETNPYRSPLAERGEEGHEEHDMERHHSGTGSDQQPASNFNSLPRAFGATFNEGSDRSQTSSVGAKGFGTVNPLTGWPGVPSIGTPDRERPSFNAFGTSIFSPMNDLQSPLGGLGGVFGGPSLGRGNSKLGSLFPPAMQAQMHANEEHFGESVVPDLRQNNPLGAIGRGPIGTQPRDTDSPVRSVRNTFEDLFASESTRSPFTTEPSQPGLTATTQGLGFPTTAAPSYGSTQTASELGARTMVMPDRMRWVYLDPQGITQGPFSGLEMNDWYKANFFSADLRVKRVEDQDFEALGQLIRRIGNSREPFLVPQMGIPHGPAPTTGPFSLNASEAIPPLQNAFPSFGRTLTAAQQNDLERRKQEEQLFQARQREMHHYPPIGRLPIQPSIPGLHHHSSAHSLQSQPSFGSISSPIGMQPPIGPIGPNAGFFDTPSTISHSQIQTGLGNVNVGYAPDLNPDERQFLASTGALPNVYPGQQSGLAGGDVPGLRSQLPGVDQLKKDPEGFSERLKEFHDLRAQQDSEHTAAAAAAVAAAVKQTLPEVKEEVIEQTEHVETVTRVEDAVQPEPPVSKKAARAQKELSLTEQVKKTQADAAAAAAAAVSKPAQQPPASGLPMPFPPPAQTTPLAAPTAQRPASGLPARYDERSASGTPDTTSDAAALAPPPPAPWAPQPGTEVQKGPSLKEIQEAEAKKAAKKAEAERAAQQAALEREAAALREREKAAAISTGLPATSTWGTGSPVGVPVTGTGSAWKQPAAVKASPAPASKKTLADIQREEEARKAKQREQAAQNAAVSGAAIGKRYADLASKGSVAPPGLANSAAAAALSVAAGVAGANANAVGGGGWSTVGAGGKVKIPTGPAAQTRAASVGNVKAPVIVSKPAATPKPVGTSLKDARGQALEDLKRWLIRELTRGLNNGVDGELTLPMTLLLDVY